MPRATIAAPPGSVASAASTVWPSIHASDSPKMREKARPVNFGIASDGARRWPPPRGMDRVARAMTTPATIVVCTLDRATYLRRLLAWLGALDHPVFEVVV